MIVCILSSLILYVGHRPYKITYASDHFPQLYKYALELINKDHAYVCHQAPSEVRGREAPPSPWRKRPREESLKLFEVSYNYCMFSLVVVVLQWI